MMEKKSQLYIFAALILIGIAFTIASSRNISLPKKATAFDSLTSNFKTEAPKVVNRAIMENKNVSTEVLAFASQYQEYARSRDPSIKFMYVLFDEDKVLVENYMGEKIEVYYDRRYDIESKNYVLLPRKDIELMAVIDNIDYDFYLADGMLGINAVFKSDKEGNVRISVIK